MRSEKEVDNMIADMVKRNKGKYITQGVSFNKTCPRQMDLLKKSLMSSVSFSGLAKEMLALRFEKQIEDYSTPKLVYSAVGQGMATHPSPVIPIKPKEEQKTKNIGNFI